MDPFTASLDEQNICAILSATHKFDLYTLTGE